MTELELIYGIRERVRELADDSDISDEQILFELNVQRAFWYRNEFNKKSRVIDDTIKQHLCMNVVEEKANLCGCTDEGCFVMRTEKAVPSTIALHTGPSVLMVKGNDVLSHPYSLVQWVAISTSGNSKFTQKDVYAALGPGNYIYLKSKNKLVKTLKQIIATVLLENPKDAKTFVNCVDNEPCYNGDKEYPLRAHVYAQIAPVVVNALLQREGLLNDKTNNTSDESQRGL